MISKNDYHNTIDLVLNKIDKLPIYLHPLSILWSGNIKSPGISDIDLFSIKSFQDSLNNYLNSEINNNLIDSNYKIVLKTNYKRSYWLSNDKKIRATIDTNLKTSPGYDLGKSIYLSDSILEFKYLPRYENYFRNFFKEIESGLRAVKYSKYVRSFFELNNSGLIK